MNFCQNYFSKDLDQLTESDLVAFFSTPQKETQYIEFKSSGETNVEQVFNKTLKPAVCSFLNSEGGILIYGAPREDRRNPENPENFKLRPYPPKFLGDHDSIIRKIADGITPMPIGVRLKEVEVEAGMVAVFEIQESQSKPHQTDNIYQIRIDGQKKPAPHYLIEAMMKQITFPDIRVYCKITAASELANGTDQINIKFSVFIINFSEFQNEKNLKIRIGIAGRGYISIGDTYDGGRSKTTDYLDVDLLSFGEPNQLRFCIGTRYRDIQINPFFEITCLFHGRSSPSKMSNYKLDCSNLNHPTQLVNPLRLIHEVHNLLLSDHQKKLGISHIEALESSLGIKIN